MELQGRMTSCKGSNMVQTFRTCSKPFSSACSKAPARSRHALCRTAQPSSDAPAAESYARPVGAKYKNMHTISEAISTPSTSGAALPDALLPLANPTTLAVAGGLALTAYGLKKILDTPSRTYDNNVGNEYDAWTEEGKAGPAGWLHRPILHRLVAP